MIPQKLNLKNFMAYKDIEIDFSNIHVACISGENGAGKSSILDSITWCLWEQARTSQKDNLIRLGENEMHVELTFKVENNTYRVIRKLRKINKTSQSILEFQILSSNNTYKSLTGKGVKETQNKIIEVIKMDYDTFINSVFILQGKSDEFTTKKPKERKEILSNILNLYNYDKLNEKAKEIKKEFLIKRDYLSNDIEIIQEQIKEEVLLLKELENLYLEKNNLEILLKSKELEILKNKNIKDDICNQILKLEALKKVYTKNIEIFKQKQNDLEFIKDKIIYNNEIISLREEIENKYNLLTELKEKENNILEKYKKFLELKNYKNDIEIKIKNEKNNIENELSLNISNLKNLEIDLNDKEKIIKEKDKVLNAFEKYKKAKEEENIYQSKIDKFHNLSNTKSDIEKSINTISIEYTKKISELETKINEFNKIISDEDKIKDELLTLNKINDILEKLNIEKEYIEEEGKKNNEKIRYSEMIKKANQEKIEDLKLKIEILEKEKSHNCPMCNKTLDDNDKKYLIKKYYDEIEILYNSIKKEELNISNSSKQNKILRKRWEEISEEISKNEKNKVYYEAKKNDIARINNLKQNVIVLKDELEMLLNKRDNSTKELHNKLNLIKEEINILDFSQEKYTLIQAEIKNWEWSENKLKQIIDLEKQIINLKQKINDLTIKIKCLNDILINNNFCIVERNNLEEINRQINNLGYNESERQEIANKIKELKKYENLYQELQTVNYKISELEMQKEKLISEINDIEKDIDNEKKELEKLPTLEKELLSIKNIIISLENNYLGLQNQIKNIEIDIARYKDKIKTINLKKDELKNKKEEFIKVNKKIEIYDIIIKAFDKNGIPSLIIENIIPEIEADSNDILSRITEGRMHVSFDTLKTNKTNDKTLETLDIYISDELGIRPYEMYSGGEAFRINFAIRLALSKVLARRSGAKLKTLIIDEGFGTQDSKGISALIEAINSISDNFEKILVVTHVNELKEAFESRIEVYKTQHGSKVKLI